MIPVDVNMCQAEHGGAFMLGPGMVRCSEKPTYIATEKEPGPDGKKGSMSLCDSCKAIMEKRMPVHALFLKLKRAK